MEKLINQFRELKKGKTVIIVGKKDVIKQTRHKVQHEKDGKKFTIQIEEEKDVTAIITRIK